MLEKFFKLKEHGTTVRIEVLAGLTTFVTMAYILIVNPVTLSDPTAIMGDAELAAQIFNGVFIATCLASFLGTILMGLYANIPFALAPGMGLNAFFAYTVMLGMGYSYSQTLGIVFISGLLFIAITIFGLRQKIVEAIPANIKLAISGGIGLFLAFVGMQNAKIVVNNDATLVQFIDLSKIGDAQAMLGDIPYHAAAMNALLAIIGLVIITVLHTFRIKGAIIIGIVAATIIGIPMGVTQLPSSFSLNLGTQFSDFAHVSLGAFAGGLGELFAGKDLLSGIFTVLMLVISFSLVDMFDTIGTLLGTAKKAGLLDREGNMARMKQALMCDSIATAAGAMLGTSTVTTFVESSAGIGEGGRTGLTSVVTAVLFLAALILAPIIGIIPSAATAPALIFVGVMMMFSIKEVDFSRMDEAVPAFLTIAMMPLTYSIANGIALGLISYVLIKALTGKFKDIKVMTYILAALFIVRYFLMTI